MCTCWWMWMNMMWVVVPVGLGRAMWPMDMPSTVRLASAVRLVQEGSGRRGCVQDPPTPLLQEQPQVSLEGQVRHQRHLLCALSVSLSHVGARVPSCPSSFGILSFACTLVRACCFRNFWNFTVVLAKGGHESTHHCALWEPSELEHHQVVPQYSDDILPAHRSVFGPSMDGWSTTSVGQSPPPPPPPPLNLVPSPERTYARENQPSHSLTGITR